MILFDDKIKRQMHDNYLVNTISFDETTECRTQA